MCQMLAKWLNWLSNIRSDNQVQQFQNNNSELLEEENQVILDGLCSVKTWTFLLPSKKHWINIPIHALISGILVFLSSQMLSNSNIQSSIGVFIPELVVIYFSWFSIVLALHSLVIQAPPETAMFRYVSHNRGPFINYVSILGYLVGQKRAIFAYF